MEENQLGHGARLPSYSALNDQKKYPIVDEIACNGWDLRKALTLFSRTNGALLEWLRSPIRYIEQGSLAADLRRLAPVNPSVKARAWHPCHAHPARGPRPSATKPKTPVHPLYNPASSNIGCRRHP